MSTISVHQTHTQKIQDSSKEGWEFWCPQCNYQARYITKNGHDSRTLEIINDGDPGARHTSTSTEYGDLWEEDYSKVESDNSGKVTKNEDEIWLPSHLERQIEDILNRLDKDGGVS